jgi:hypothetical protein
MDKTAGLKNISGLRPGFFFSLTLHEIEKAV